MSTLNKLFSTLLERIMSFKPFVVFFLIITALYLFRPVFFIFSPFVEKQIAFRRSSALCENRQ